MNRVLFITTRGEQQVFADADLSPCITETIRLNANHGYRAGVYVIERSDGYRMTATDCKAAA